MDSLREQLLDLAQLEAKPLSDTDLQNLMDGQCSIHLYRDIKNIKSVDKLLGPYNCAMILFEWEPGYGHWICLSKHGNLIEYFDPYGQFIDHWIEYVPKDFAKESNQDHSYLSKLLLKSKYDLSYNEYPFQSEKKGISTCGRWSVIRGILKDLPLNEFKDFFLSKDGDKLATVLTS